MRAIARHGTFPGVAASVAVGLVRPTIAFRVTHAPENVTCDSTLWVACIGGAAQRDANREAIECAGLRLMDVRENPEYRFLSRSARNASDQYGVRSVSVLAVKPVD